ncbi:MAG TPA: catalase [Anaerolineales bacterium]|nr:catalase [Anaerolineales bacterium]
MNQDEMLDDLAERIQQMQAKAQLMAQKRNPTATLRRGFHAKGTGVRAKFQVRSDIPQNLQVGLFQPGTTYNALVRFSNARGEVLGDLSKDQRGVAIRVKTNPGERLITQDTTNIQDFLMTNTPISFARNPVQFIEVGEILLGGIAKVVPRLVKKYGFQEARRILAVFLAPVISFKPYQMNEYWSRTSYQFGDRAVRYLIRPTAGTKIASTREQLVGVAQSLVQGGERKEEYLRQKLKEALRADDVCFDFCIQLFVDEKRTPVEDAYIEWKESDAPPIPLATLTIPKQDLDLQLQQDIERMAFNPWHTQQFTPLGLINLARKKVYDASAAHRGASLPSRAQ